MRVLYQYNANAYYDLLTFYVEYTQMRARPSSTSHGKHALKIRTRTGTIKGMRHTKVNTKSYTNISLELLLVFSVNLNYG